MRVAFVTCALVLLGATSARAQDVAPPTAQGNPNKTRLAGQLGGTWSSGNSKSYAANIQLRVSHRRGMDQLTWSGVANYGRATAQEEGTEPDGREITFKQDSLYYTRVRYDRFFLEHNTLFIGAMAFRDTGSGFRARYSPYAGYQRVILTSEAFELWSELGYRVAREYLFLDRQAREDGLPEARWLHGPALGVGIEAKLGETLDFDLGAEAQRNVNVESDYRVFSVASLTNRIGRGFALGMNLNLRWLYRPIGGREPLDTQLQVVAILDQTIAAGAP